MPERKKEVYGMIFSTLLVTTHKKSLQTEFEIKNKIYYKDNIFV